MILTDLKLKKNLGNIELWNIKQNVEKKNEKTLKIAQKLPKSPCFVHFLEKKIFLISNIRP